MADVIKDGDIIKIHYTGRLKDGEEFDSTRDRDPLIFVVGVGQVVKGFDQAVLGMAAGDKKTIHLAPELAYGPQQPENLLEFPLAGMPHLQSLKVGMQLKLPLQGGRAVSAKVVEVTEEIIRLDANHPLAGKTLTFDLEIVETGLDPARLYAEAVAGPQ
jgi:peptidylprolyl isomerase